MRNVLRNYTRWIRSSASGHLHADILTSGPYDDPNDVPSIAANPAAGNVFAYIKGSLSPDEARLYGVRLIEAAALADGERAIRDTRRD